MRRSVYRKAEAGGRFQPVCMECMCVCMGNTFILIVLTERLHLGAGNLERMARRVISGQRRVQRSKGVIRVKLQGQ